MNAITKRLGGSISLIYIIHRGWLSLIHWICFVVSVCYWISFFCCNNEEHFWLHWPLYFQFFWRNCCFFCYYPASLDLSSFLARFKWAEALLTLPSKMLISVSCVHIFVEFSKELLSTLIACQKTNTCFWGCYWASFKSNASFYRLH